MLAISITRFARFCATTNASRAVAVREGIAGSDGQDVYLHLKQAVREAVATGDAGVFDRLVQRSEGTRLSIHLPTILPPLRRFLTRAEAVAPAALIVLPIAPGIGVRVNPEFTIQIAGRVFVVKLWFAVEPPDDELVEAITSIMYAADESKRGVPAVFDVRRARLRTGTAKREDHSRVVRADGLAFAALVNDVHKPAALRAASALT